MEKRSKVHKEIQSGMGNIQGEHKGCSNSKSKRGGRRDLSEEEISVLSLERRVGVVD